MKQFLISILYVLLFSSVSFAQPTQAWVKSYNGTSNSLDYGRSLRIDANGNSYMGGTISNSGSGKDIAVVKYDPAGNQQWVAKYNGTANKDDWAYAIVLDAAGNIYATGFTTTNATGKDVITVKFDSSGAFRWAAQYNAPDSADDYANHIAIDQWANVSVTGISRGDTTTADDYVTIKYDSSGTQLWVARYNGPGNSTDDARTIATDKEGNVYTSGGSIGIGSDYDFATIKYSAAGNQQWVARYNGPKNSYDLVYYQGSVLVDSLENVYITGYSFGLDSTLDYATIKYDSLGNELWVSRYSTEVNGTDYADALTIDKDLNVYVTGGSTNTPHDYDFATVKYDSAGNQKWVAHYNGTGNSWDEAYGVVTDDSLNVYILGRSPGTSTSADFVTLKYDSAGNQQWEIRYEHNGYDWPFNIRYNEADGSIYVGGWTSPANGMPDMTVIKYAQTIVGLNALYADNNASVIIFPNPFTTSAIVQIDNDVKIENAEFRVFNILGKETIHVTGINAHWINLTKENLSPGVYFFNLMNNDLLIANGKIVIQ